MSSLHSDAAHSHQHQDTGEKIKKKCTCNSPKCGKCGLSIDLPSPGAEEHIQQPEYCSDDVAGQIASAKGLQDVLHDSLGHTDTSELKRACSRIYHTYSKRLGEKLFKELSECPSKEEMVILLCDQIGMENIQPLISLLELLQIQQDSLQKGIDTLKEHQMKVPGLSKCIECTSPPRTPVPYSGQEYKGNLRFLVGFELTPSYYQHSSKQSDSPPSSPTAGNILQFAPSLYYPSL